MKILLTFVLFGLQAALNTPDENCRIFSADYKHCVLCSNGHLFNPASKVCEKAKKPVENCAILAEDGKCQFCSPKFFLEGGACKKCAENCEFCTNTVCITCASGFALVEGVCAEKCDVQNCHSCPAGYVQPDVPKPKAIRSKAAEDEQAEDAGPTSLRGGHPAKDSQIEHEVKDVPEDISDTISDSKKQAEKPVMPKPGVVSANP